MFQARLSTIAVYRALLSALAVLCAMALAPAAHAAVHKELSYSTQWPTSPDRPMALSFDFDPPSTWPAGDLTPQEPVAITATLDATDLAQLGAARASIGLEVKVAIVPASGAPATATWIRTSLDGAIESGPAPSTLKAPLSLSVLSPLSLPLGESTLVVESVSLGYVTLRDAAGAFLPELPKFPGGGFVRASLDPAGQDTTLTALTGVARAEPSPRAKQFTQQCDWPLGTEGVSSTVDLDAGIPDSLVAGEVWPQWRFDFEATFDTNAYFLTKLAQGASVEGDATVDLELTLPGGATLPFSTVVPLANVALPAVAGPFTLRGTGEVPAVLVPADVGAWKLRYTGMNVELSMRKADGTLKRWPLQDGDGDNPTWIDVPCALTPTTQDLELATGSLRLPDPALVKPVVTLDSIAGRSAQVSWTSADALGGAERYELLLSGEAVATVPGSVRSYTLTGLEPDTSYSLVVRAVDDDAPLTVASTPLALKTLPGDEPPTAPGKPVVSELTDTGGKVCWGAAQGAGEVLEYRVYVDGSTAGSTTSTCLTLSGLNPSTSYAVSVVAVGRQGVESQRSPVATFTTVSSGGEGFARYGYDLSGAVQLKNLARGAVPLAGSMRATLIRASGEFSADLELRRSTAKLVALGFLPVVAKVDPVPTPLAGRLTEGVLTAAVKVRFKLPQVTLFGLQLAGGSNCQTRSASAINLKSVGEFDALDGGTLAGTFSISDLTGCGVLTGLVSPLTSGPGNTIALKLAPATA